jgi:PKD repeat protein
LPEAFTIDAPISGLTAESDSPTQLGEVTTFTATVTGGTNVTFSWDFGDDSAFGNGANVTHTYAAAGEYTVILTASNSFGSEQVPLQVVVIGPPVKSVYLPLLRK